LNPGSHAPQACILIQSSRENTGIHGFTLLLDDGPAYADYNKRIINTLEKMLADGLKLHTRHQVYYTLRDLNRHVDMMNPEAVKTYIGTLKKQNGEPASEATKEKKANNYNYFVIYNELQWQKPKYTYDSKVPITPTKEQAEAIISSAPTLNSATIFRMLLESGFEGEELHCTTEKDIDTEQGIITVAGHKQHSGRSYRFKPSTREMLKLYISNHQSQLHPFPRPQIMGESWRTARQKASQKLSRPDLNKIPLKGLRNLSGILVWQKCRDPWIVMTHMGHKKLETTQHYLKAMTIQQLTETEWISKAVQLGTPNTIKEIMELIDAGFRKETEADGYQIFRKPK
jgi:integrase